MEGLLAMWNMTEPVLIVLVEENPKQPGSAARERFALPMSYYSPTPSGSRQKTHFVTCK